MCEQQMDCTLALINPAAQMVENDPKTVPRVIFCPKALSMQKTKMFRDNY